MQPVKIAYNSPSVNTQLEFLIRRDVFPRGNSYKKAFFYLLGWTVVLLAFSYFTEDSFVVLKAVLLYLTTLALLVFVIIAIVFFVKFQKRSAWKRQALMSLSRNTGFYFLSFDDDQLFIETDTYSSQIKWNYFDYYAEDKDSLFIIPKRLYESIACSKVELGVEEYERLKTLLSSKLSPLDQKNGA